MNSAQAVGGIAAQNRALRRAVRLLALVLVIGTPLFVAGYLIDQHVEPGPTLLERTVDETEALVMQNPSDIGLRLKLAAAYAADSRNKDAAAQYDAILLASPENVPALLGKAGFLASAGDAATAQELYQQVVDLRKDGEMAKADRDLERAFYGLGTTSMALGKYADAIAPFEAALQIDGTDADVWYSLAEAQFYAGSSAQAVAAARNAVAFVPVGWSEPYALLAKIFSANQAPEEAAWATAMADLSEKRYAEAKAALTPLVDGPAAADASIGLAFLAEIEGDAAAALTWYQKAYALRPSDPTAQSGVVRMGGVVATPTPDPTPTPAPSTSPGTSPAPSPKAS